MRESWESKIINPVKDSQTEKPQASGTLCRAHNRAGKPCGKFAVNGWNVCRLHGAGGGRPATRPATILKNALQADELRLKADALVESGVDVLDLRQVAAMLHVLSSELADKRSDAKAVPLLLQCLESLRKCAESVERIRASKAFTTAERDWIVLALSDFVEMMPEPERVRFHDFISARLLLKSTPLSIAAATV
jgi:hypothetical protein